MHGVDDVIEYMVMVTWQIAWSWCRGRMHGDDDVEEYMVREYYRPTLGRDGFFMLPMLSRPKSVGTVTLKSRNPFDPPVLDPNCLSHPDDVELMVKAAKASLKLGNAKIFRRALGAEPFKKPIPGCAHLEFQSDDYWRCFVRGMAGAMSHISGTCKMAPDSDPMGVVTPRLM
ncbi:hypothetical protein HAZT_HAZT003954 [Hyalella azteca]|uniref:Glucose-methanol-choline oxidoreductase C-terminal domain-containing protein n=1 Tax=Hyalella azteca TaxID=294128 RepID=A0A6A0GXK2_HYAAZ|nr:hypothetical protein HAZT_HAZT003954 [Hyalella azteca]